MSAISPTKRYLCLLLVTGISLFIPSALPLSDAWSSSHALAHAVPTTSASAIEQTARARLNNAFAKLPLRFEPSLEQTDASAKFFARGSNYRVLVAPTEAVIELPLAAASSSRTARQMIRLRMQMVGASRTARVIGTDALAGKSNYFAGSDPSKWRTNISTYGRVQVENIYRGVDVVYYGQGGALEYDFNLAAGTDVKTIRLRFEGAAQLRVDSSGDLLMDTAGGVIRQHKPVAYQFINGTRREVAAGYTVDRKGEVGFAVGDYDVGQPLVIDPVLSYSQYLFIDISDSIQSIALDGAGNAYVTGWYYTNQPQHSLGDTVYALTGPADMFVFKFDPTGSTILYSTFLSGGISSTNQNSVFYQSYGLAVDAAGNAYVTGAAGTDNYPITPGAFQPSLQGEISAVVTKLSPAGNLLYSTFLGGSKNGSGVFIGKAVNAGRAIAVDGAGNAYVTGVTDATNFPLLNPAQAQNQGGTCDGGDVTFPCAGEAFVTKLNPTGTALVYSTYLGGLTNDYGNAIAVDGAGNAYVAGLTFARNFPTVNAVQPAAASPINEAFVAKLNAAGNALIYSTYLGGSGSDTANGLAVDAAGNAYVTGTTTSTDFPTTPGAFQPAPANKPVFKSVNGGGLWQAATTGIPGDQSVSSLQVDPRTPATLYATTNAGLYKSTNGGGQWQRLGFGIRNLVIDPQNPATLYASFAGFGGELLFRSTDGGKTWRDLNSQDLNFGSFAGLAVDPTDSATLYVSVKFAFRSPAGVYKSTNSGANWQLANKGIAPALPTLVAVNPRKPARVFAATETNALFRSKNRAKKWQLVFSDGNVQAIVFDPHKGSKMYLATSSGVFKSGDGGSTWSLTGLSGNITALAIDPLTPSTLYAARNAAGVQTVFKSTDGGDNWTAINNGLNGNQLVALAVDPQTPGTVYVAGAGGGAEAFVTKLDPTGTALVYSTYLGGENDEGGFGIAVDASGNAYIAGRTQSVQFPTLNSLQLERRNAGIFYDAFITKLNAAGAALVYSTTFGGNHDDMGLCIARDSAGAVYIGGTTRSEDLPALNPAPVHLGNLQYAFIAKLTE